ncbi:MAG TPA: DUF2157 domain-containing protein [Terracidiphilus sp.]|jgi:uncharacterized membrane protein
MADIEGLLNRWKSAGVLEGETAERIRAWESDQKHPSGLRWQGIVALILGGILLATGVILFVSAHWDDLSPGTRFALVVTMVALFHLSGGIAREKYLGLSTALHAVGTVSTGAAIALVGQIFNIEEHWPAAVLMWALAALAGWALLRDEAQQTLALLLFPAWIFCELKSYTDLHIGQVPYLGRFLLVWAIFYFTMLLDSRRKAVRGILFAAAAIAAVVGTVMMTSAWASWSASQTAIPFGTRFWAWTVIAVVPLTIAAFRGHWGLIPPASAVAVAVALPWCQRTWIEHYEYGQGVKGSFTRSDPNLLAHVLVAAFAVFMIGWGVRRASRALVNLGIVYFAIAVTWFYFSNIFDKVGRSLGLIGLGILFLAGGWALEKARRGLLARMSQAGVASEEAR